ncbi:hypothetical protein CSUI_011580, partial [Cystoisospora suis]
MWTLDLTPVGYYLKHASSSSLRQIRQFLPGISRRRDRLKGRQDEEETSFTSSLLRENEEDDVSSLRQLKEKKNGTTSFSAKKGSLLSSSSSPFCFGILAVVSFREETRVLGWTLRRRGRRTGRNTERASGHLLQ